VAAVDFFLPALQPGQDIALESECLEIPLNIIPGVESELPAALPFPVDLITDVGQKAAGLLPGSKGEAVLIRIEFVLLLPVEVKIIPRGRNLTDGTTQRFPLKFPFTKRTFLFGSDFADHAENIIWGLSICQWT